MWWDCSSWLKEACSLSGGSKSNWAKRWSQYLSACHQSKAVATYSYMCLEVSIVTGAKPEERHTQHRACTSGNTQPAGHTAVSRKQHFTSTLGLHLQTLCTPGGEESKCSFLCSAPGMFSGHSVTEMSRLSWNKNTEHPWVCSQTESLAWGCSSARHPKPCQTPKKKLTVVCPGIALRVVCSKQVWTSKFFFFNFHSPLLPASTFAGTTCKHKMISGL